MTLENN